MFKRLIIFLASKLIKYPISYMIARKKSLPGYNGKK